MASSDFLRLSPEETAHLVLLAQGSDPVAERAKTKLYETHKRLIQKLVNQFCPFTSLKEHAFQEGAIGLLHAIAEFDPIHKAKFITFAYHCIKSAICDYVECELPGHKARRRERPALVELKDMTAYKELGFERAEKNADDWALLMPWWERLNYDQRAIMKEVFWNDKSLSEVARLRGVSREAVRRQYQRALKNAKKIIPSGM